MAHFYYILDKTYNDSVDYTTVVKIIRPLIQKGQSVKEYLNKKETSIYLAVTIKGKFYKFRTGYKIKPVYWEQERQSVRQSYHNSFEMNTGLVLLKQRTERTYLTTLNENPGISVSEIKDVIKATIERGEPKDDPKPFFEVYQQYLEEKKKSVKSITIKKLVNLRNLLIEFEQKHYKIQFQKIDPGFEVDLKYFFSHDKKHLNNTTYKHMALFKTFMNWCVDRGIHDNHQYKKFKAKEDPCDIIYLQEAELMKLFHIDLSGKPYLDRIRDRFCLACFTGQRHSDIRNFKWSDIQFVEGGYEWWLFQVKGNKAKKVVIPLSDSAIVIIRKYPRVEGKDIILPPLSNTNANLYVKELCKLAEINEPTPVVKYSGKKRIEKVFPKYELITMHTARKTFVTLSLEKGMSPEFVMEITGHEDYKTMRKYLAINQKAVKNVFNQIWNNSKHNNGGNLPLELKVV